MPLLNKPLTSTPMSEDQFPFEEAASALGTDPIADVLADANALRNREVMDAFGRKIYSQWQTNASYRRPVELEWLENLRQYKGLYDPEVRLDPRRSKVYPKLTRSKCNIVLSRLHEMLFPDKDRNWSVSPSPEPEVPDEIVQSVAQNLIIEDPQTGEVVYPQPEQIRRGILEYCKVTCERMSRVIADQFLGMKYDLETKKVLRSGIMYGTGIMKGPLVRGKLRRQWAYSEIDKKFRESKEVEDEPYYEFVRLWDWYPDMTITDPETAEGFYERHVLTKHDLRELTKREDFFGDIIKEILDAHPNGSYAPQPWEVDLQTIEIQSSMGTGRSTAVSGSTNDYTQIRRQGVRYDAIEYWGFVDGQALESCGLEINDSTIEYEANIWVCCNKVIKAVVFDGARKRYKIFYFDKDETSIFGEGLPRLMRHSQIAISSAARMMLDNAAVTAGPQVEANLSLITPGTDIDSFYPQKIWYREGRGVDAQYPALRSLQFDSHIQEYAMIINTFKTFADEETCLPTWMISQESGPNETARGTSMRMSSLNISIKDVVRNFDDFTESVVSDLYAWNMEFNAKDDIKGDYQVFPRGVSSLVHKEIRMQALTQMYGSLQPGDWAYVPKRDFLNEMFKAHDLDITLRTEKEAQEYSQSQVDLRAKELAYAEVEAEIAYRKAQALHMVSKAKDTNIEAEHKIMSGPGQGEIPNPALMAAEADAAAAKAEETRAKANIHLAKAGVHQAEAEATRLKPIIDASLQERKDRAGAEIQREDLAGKRKIQEKVGMKKASQRPVAPVRGGGVGQKKKGK